MHFEPLKLEGAYKISLNRHNDERGWFSRSFCKNQFLENGLNFENLQSNISYNIRKHTIRGMHWQCSPNEEVKVIRCTKGKAFDVMVDLRPDSPTFGTWESLIISEYDNFMIYIPQGFAHGFQTLEDSTEIHYMMGSEYQPNCQRGFNWLDPEIAIKWPNNNDYIISEKDSKLP